MIDTVQILAEPPMAPLFGVAGLATRMASPLFVLRGRILSLQLASSCFFALSYALMDQKTATAVCLIGAIQTTVALLAEDRPWFGYAGYVFLPFVLIIGAITYSGAPTILAVTACCLMMVGRLQRDMLRMRGIQLCSGPFGAAHDVLVGAWPSLVAAVLSFIVAAAAFRREATRIAAA